MTINQEDINNLLDLKLEPEAIVDEKVATEELSVSNTIEENSTDLVSKIIKEEYVDLVKELDLSKSLESILKAVESKINWQEVGGLFYKKFSASDTDVIRKFLSASYGQLHSFEKEDTYIKVSITDRGLAKAVDDNYRKASSDFSEPTVKLSAVATAPVETTGTNFNLKEFNVEVDDQIIEPYELDKDYYLKVPVAKVGRWKNLAYGEVSFTREDLQEIIRNFENDELGFEPPIYYGHSRGKDGVPSRGILVKLELIGDVLFGYWNVNKETYRAVEDGVYRYSSAELVYDLPNKRDGVPLKVVLYGMALTNIPFIPNMPRTQALEDANIGNNVVWLSFSPSVEEESESTNKPQEEKKETDMEQPKTEKGTLELEFLRAQVEEYANKVKELELTRQELAKAAEIKSLKDQLEEYSVKITDYETTRVQLSEAVSQNKQLADKLVEYENHIKNQKVEQKIAEIKQLALPETMKETYYSLIREGKLGEGEDAVIDSLKALALSFNTTVIAQQGNTASTANLNNAEYVDPYQEEIERCKKVLQQRSIK